MIMMGSEEGTAATDAATLMGSGERRSMGREKGVYLHVHTYLLNMETIKLINTSVTLVMILNGETFGGKNKNPVLIRYSYVRGYLIMSPHCMKF